MDIYPRCGGVETEENIFIERWRSISLSRKCHYSNNNKRKAGDSSSDNLLRSNFSFNPFTNATLFPLMIWFVEQQWRLHITLETLFCFARTSNVVSLTRKWDSEEIFHSLPPPHHRYNVPFRFEFLLPISYFRLEVLLMIEKLLISHSHHFSPLLSALPMKYRKAKCLSVGAGRISGAVKKANMYCYDKDLLNSIESGPFTIFTSVAE